MDDRHIYAQLKDVCALAMMSVLVQLQRERFDRIAGRFDRIKDGLAAAPVRRDG